ncbi:MAG: YicC family protein [Proteobacteria bacterium]|nr:YicC family protein [Pseudomonadota bacterium]
MRSMTGFGRGSAEFGKGRMALEIKTVNHRFLEVRSKIAKELIAGEAHVDRLLRKRLSRGYCTVNLWYEGSLGGTMSIDKNALKAHLESLIEVSDDTELCLADLIPVLASTPDLFVTPRIQNEEAFEKAIEIAFHEAADKLINMREKEGTAMAEDLSKRLAMVRKYINKIDKLAVNWPKTVLSRIQERLGVLLADFSDKINTGRVEAEAALLADRADITEEIVRFKSHCEQMAVLTESDEPVGRKAEFLIQEIGREINTIGAKASLLEISTLVVDIKAELEKMRELAQNIE